MNFWLFTLINRIISGERYEKSTKADVQLYGSAFASVPIFLLTVVFVLEMLGDSPPWIIWLSATVLGSAYFFIWFMVLRRFPIWLLIVIAVISWPTFAMFTWS